MICDMVLNYVCCFYAALLGMLKRFSFTIFCASLHIGKDSSLKKTAINHKVLKTFLLCGRSTNEKT